MSVNEQQLELENTGELPTEQAEFLKALEAEEAAEDFDPEEAQAEQAEAEQQAEMNEQTAKMTAAMGLGTIEFALKRFIHPQFEFSGSTKAYAVENLSPVLIKYGALLPEWIEAYDAEIKAAMAVGKLVSDGMETSRELKAKDAAEAKAKQQDTQDDKERVRVAA